MELDPARGCYRSFKEPRAPWITGLKLNFIADLTGYNSFCSSLFQYRVSNSNSSTALLFRLAELRQTHLTMENLRALVLDLLRRVY
jgi:hypothetical protein